MLKQNKKTCSSADLTMVARLFEENTNSIPPTYRFCDSDGRKSEGFYIPFLMQTKYNAAPEAFFKILQVDRKIGWTNPAHVESRVFFYKAINIIDDEKVSRGTPIFLL